MKSETIQHKEQSSNARRIAAALTACEGIETEILEGAHINGIILKLAKERNRLLIEVGNLHSQFTGVLQQNARLREALERIASHFDMDGYGENAWKNLALEMAETARTAIAEIEQKNPRRNDGDS